MLPGDRITLFSGQTVEILNADAEGRLILADGLTWAIRREGCTHLVDIATLTGAVYAMLGYVTTGVMASDDRDGDLTDQILIKGVTPALADSSAQVTYIVFDSANNMATVTRTVRYTDYQAPRFALSRPLVYPLGQTVTLLDRLTASDVLDGDISKNIRLTSQNIVNSQPGVYNVTAQVDSRLGEPVVLPLKVVITTGETQLIWLKDYLIYLPQGASFDAAGYIDSVVAPDGSTLAASQVSVDDPVNTSVPGVYYVGYTVAAQGQSYTVYLTVVVE